MVVRRRQPTINLLEFYNSTQPLHYRHFQTTLENTNSSNQFLASLNKGSICNWRLAWQGGFHVFFDSGLCLSGAKKPLVSIENGSTFGWAVDFDIDAQYSKIKQAAGRMYLPIFSICL